MPNVKPTNHAWVQVLQLQRESKDGDKQWCETGIKLVPTTWGNDQVILARARMDCRDGLAFVLRDLPQLCCALAASQLTMCIFSSFVTVAFCRV